MGQPFGNRWSHSIPKCVVAKRINVVLLELSRRREGPATWEAHYSFALFRRETPDLPFFGILDIGPAPVSSCVAGRTGVEAVGNGLVDGSISIIFSNARLKWRKSGLPMLFARLNIPAAAFGFKKYFSGTVDVSMTPNNVDSLA